MIWRSIEGFSNYEVSDHGKVRSIKRKKTRIDGQVMNLRQKLLRLRWNKISKCYFLDIFNDQGERKTVYVHRLVASAFVENTIEPKEDAMVIRLDNNSRNNHYSNLKFVSRSEHMKFQFEVGNKDNFKVWKTRKSRYSNGFKPTTILRGRPKKSEE